MALILTVGMADVKICRAEGGILTALGLGSCIGVCIYDPVICLAGMAHVVLPQSGSPTDSPGKFADTAIPYLFAQMEYAGARIGRLRAALVGGAQLFKNVTQGSRLDIGPRNASAVRDILESFKVCIVAADVGGSVGRTALLHNDGRVMVRTLGQSERLLVNLMEGTDNKSLKSVKRNTEKSGLIRNR